MAEERQDVLGFLLNCQICLEPFDRKLRIPRVLPCHHTYCSPCIAKLDKGGNLACPNDRKEFKVSGPFPVDFTRASLVEHKDVLLRKGGASSPLEEACQKHQDKKLEFFCSTCRSALCSECAVIEHKDKVGHDIVRLGDVVEQVKGEIKVRSEKLDVIRESSLQPRAKMAATSLQETDASFQDAEREIEDVFSEAVNALLDRKSQAVEELRSKWKEDRIALEDQAIIAQSLVSSAKTSTALGRTVASVGLPSHVVAQERELERAIQEAKAEGRTPLLSSLLYKVNTNLLGLMKCTQELGAVRSERTQPCERTRPKQGPMASAMTSLSQPPEPPVTSASQETPEASAVTSSTITSTDFRLEHSRCSAGCRVSEDGKTLTSKPRPASFRLPRLRKSGSQAAPQAFSFAGTCGCVDLAQPALHYWAVRCLVSGFHSGDRCEVGLASLQSLLTCGRRERISDHDVQAPTVLVVGDGEKWRLEGRGWTKDVDTPPPPVTSRTRYTCLEEKTRFGWGFEMTLGFLFDNRKPESPLVLVVETESRRLLGVRRLSPSPDLRPVLRVGPSFSEDNWDMELEVKAGPGVLDDVTASRLERLLGRMEL